MKNAGLRTATLFVKKDNTAALSSFIKASDYFKEVDINVRTKRAVFEYSEFTDDELIKLSSELDDMGYWGYCVSFDNPRKNEQLTSAKAIIKGTDNGFVNFKI